MNRGDDSWHLSAMTLDTVASARAAYFAANGFSAAAYVERWARVKLGPIPVVFPNTASRKRALPLHDLHHIATGFATTYTGEAEIGAWEIGGGCGDYAAAWLFNVTAFAYGLVIAPRRVYRAFVRGRHARNLYASGWDAALLDHSVGALRARVEPERNPTATLGDRLAFAAWAAGLLAPGAALVAAVAHALLHVPS
jgi:hypothetical protein